MRQFDSGATRNRDEGKPDFEGYRSPLVMHRFGQYMTKHRVQADGKVRDSDNWQKGIPIPQYMKSLLRHVEELHLLHDGYPELIDEEEYLDIESVLCAILFNAQGYLHELLKAKLAGGGNGAVLSPDDPSDKDATSLILPADFRPSRQSATEKMQSDDAKREEIKALLRMRLDRMKAEGLIDPNTEIMFID